MSVKKGYYKTHLNREKALKEYLEKYKTLKNISYNAEGKRLYDIFYKYKDDIYSTAINLGYNMEDIVGNLPNNYYNNFNIIKGKIENFILENNRFPTAKEMEKQLKINLSYMYKKYGNIYNIKELMKYDDSKDLVDLRGDINRSFGELFVANFLILNGLKDKYDREQYPFPKNEGLYRSDFTFYMDKEEIHIEIWGVKECQHDIRAIEYKKTKEIKKQLYNKYNDKIRLVEIDYDIFSKSYLEIEQHLIDKLQFIFNEELKVVDYDILIKSCKMSDQQLFDEIISLSDNSNQLPPTHKFEGSLYNEVLKRFKTLNNFALYFNVKTHTENMNWNKELIFDYFLKINKEGFIIDKTNMKKQHNNLNNVILKYGTLNDLKLEFLKNHIDIIPDIEKEWLIKLCNNLTGNTSPISDENKLDAKYILDILYSNYHKVQYCKICGKEFISLHIYDINCDSCKKSIEGNMISKYTQRMGAKYTEKDYEDNFNDVINIADYCLTMKGFNENSNIKTQGYKVYFNNMKWVDILKKYNKYDLLIAYILKEFKIYKSLNKSGSITDFIKTHQYITYDLLNNTGRDFLTNI